MKITMRNGLYIAAVIVLTDLIEYIAHTQNGNFPGLILELAGFSIFIYHACVVMRRERHDSLSYSQAFNTGMGTGFWGALVGAIILYPMLKFLDTEPVRMIRQQIPEIMEKQHIPDAQRETVEHALRTVFGPGGIAIWTFVGYILLALIISLIVAALVKRDNPDPDAFGKHEDTF